MKRLLLTAFVAIALVGTASAQTQQGFNAGAVANNYFSGQADIAILTTVVEQLTIEQGVALDFGFVATTGASNNYQPEQQGTFLITGQDGATISLQSGELTDLDLSGDGSVQVNNITFSGTGVNGNELTLSGSTVTISVSGTLFVAANAQADDYSGTYQLDVAYTAL